VTPSRATFGWLARRRFRMGQTHGKLIADEVGVIRRAWELALASAKFVYSFGAAALAAVSPVSRNRSALRGIMHAGVVSGLLGGRELQQYAALPREGTRAVIASVADKSGLE
jgi:succinoglycan biosynthesis protein ExoM